MLLYKENINNIKKDNIDLIIAPSSIYLSLFKESNHNLAIQDISLNQDLHLTGDISIESIQSLNIKYAIIGHYERRYYYHETKNELIPKIKTCLENNIKVIYCIGETLEELNRKVEYQVLEKQIANILNNIAKEELKNIIIAYEPTYNIGSKSELNIAKIKEMIIFIKKLVYDYYQSKIKIVYGGNVNKDNIDLLNSITELDGFMLGTSSLNSANIQEIISKIAL